MKVYLILPFITNQINLLSRNNDIIMSKQYLKWMVTAACFFLPAAGQGQNRQWSLEECIDYAIANNIQLQKTGLQKQSAEEDLLQSKSAMLPSLSFSTSHNLAYSPWQESGRSTVANGYVQSSVNKVYYNGSYGVNANWTVWNGNRNNNNVRLNKLTAERAALDSAETANSIEEKIIQLYVQILYSADAVNVSKESLKTSKKNEERGLEMQQVGKMSKSDVAQLTAQRVQDEYSIVEAESLLRNYKLQLKQLLELTETEDFDILIPSTTDGQALALIPNMDEVYAVALENRPEIRNSRLTIKSNELNIKIAKAGKLPTVSLAAGVGTNTTTMSDRTWGSQLKTNFDVSFGATVSIPLFDNRQTRTSVNKAVIQRQASVLDLREKEKELYSVIEGYWLNAVTNQNKFKAAQAAVESERQSYELLSEQFRLGLRNIVELMTGKTGLLTAQQNELQSKYLTIMNIRMLEFYRKENKED